MENSQRILVLCIIVFSLIFLTVKELSTERHLTIWAGKANQHVYYKSILTSKFGSKNIMPWKSGSSFVFIDETLCFPSRPISYDRPRPSENLP